MKINLRNHIYPIAIFTALALLLLMIARVSNVLIFGNWQDLGQNSEFLDDFFLRGFRFDIKLLSSALIVFVWLPVLFISWVLQDKWFAGYLKVLFSILLMILVFIILVDAGYLFYFQKPVDVLIFGLFEDDTSAIISTVLDNYKILLFFAGFLVSTVVVLSFWRKLVSTTKPGLEQQVPRTKQLLFWLLSFILLVMLARGSLDSFPLQRKHASVSANSFLNSMVMNAVFNVYYAFQDKKVNSQAVFKRNILQFNKLDDLQQLKQKAGYGDQQPLIRVTAVNKKLEQAKPHVIFISMEGWSSHIALEHSATNNVLGEFAKHADQDHFFPRVFANRYATNPTIEALLVNSPITPLAQSIANKVSFRMSNVLPFKNKGYQTLFLSGGYSSWRNHNNFWLLQGFDRYIGRSEIENHFKVDASDNPWGVYDEYVFEYVKKSLTESEQSGRPLFSFVLTTNNHPPIRLPDSYQRPSLSPSAYGFDDNNEAKLSLLSGFHYQTDQLGRFIDWLKSSEFKDRVIVVATGDHPQRTFIDNSANTDKYLRYSVPAYFYVPESLDKLKSVSRQISGSHNDLFPTLFELSLSNARYYGFGYPLMDKNKQLAYGWSAAGEFLFDQGVLDSRNKLFYPWQQEQQGVLKAEPEDVSKQQAEIIQQERYRRLLKQYLLVQDYQSQQN